jgi:hypothetical protein
MATLSDDQSVLRHLERGKELKRDSKLVAPERNVHYETIYIV